MTQPTTATRPYPHRTVLLLAALVSASLSCSLANQFTTPPQLTPVPSTNNAGEPAAGETPPPSSGLGADEIGPLQIEGGPTVASPRDARIAIEGQDAQSLLELAPETSDYSVDDLNTVPGILRYTIKLNQERNTLLFYGWCAKGADLLDQNLRDMTIEFRVADQVIPEEQLLIARSQQPDAATGETLVCQSYYAVLYDWPQGDTQLQVTIDFTKAVNDGLSEYGPGVQEMLYTVTR